MILSKKHRFSCFNLEITYPFCRVNCFKVEITYPLRRVNCFRVEITYPLRRVNCFKVEITYPLYRVNCFGIEIKRYNIQKSLFLYCYIPALRKCSFRSHEIPCSTIPLLSKNIIRRLPKEYITSPFIIGNQTFSTIPLIPEKRIFFKNISVYFRDL